MRRDPSAGTWSLLCPERPFAVPQAGDQVRCPLCPGEHHGGGHVIHEVGDEAGWQVRVVPNGVPALRVERSVGRRGLGPYDGTGSVGADEVIIESPHHAQRLHQEPERLHWAMRVAKDRMRDLRNDTRLAGFAWFRNHGAVAGARVDHPHARVVATPEVPFGLAAMADRCDEHLAKRGRALIADMLDADLDEGRRIVAVGERVAVVCPWAPTSPFEVWLVPREGGPRFGDASDGLVDELADMMGLTLRALDVVLEDPSYQAVIYDAPRGRERGFRWHVRIAPRLAAPDAAERFLGLPVVAVPPEVAATELQGVWAHDRVTMRAAETPR